MYGETITHGCDDCGGETQHTIVPIERLTRRGYRTVPALVCDECDGTSVDEIDEDFFVDPDYIAWEGVV